MIRLRNIPIERKMLVIMMAASSVAVLVAGLTFSAYSVLSFRAEMREKVKELAGLVAAYAQVPLDFDDRGMAAQILADLREHKTVTVAHIIRADGSVLAQYLAAGEGPGETYPGPHPLPKSSFRCLRVSAPVRGADGKRLGEVYIEANIARELNAHHQNTVLLILAVVLAAWLAALLVSRRLAPLIATPILHLTETARTVSREQTFSIRAVRDSNDEIGELIEQFNEMLRQIEVRDVALREREAQYRGLVENVDIGICRFAVSEAAPGKSYSFLQVNPAMAAIFGYASRADLLEVPVLDLPQDPALWTQLMDEIVEKDAIRNRHFPMRRADKEAIWISFSARAHFEGSPGHLQWIDCVMEDITLRTRTEEELRQYREELEELVRTRTAQLEAINKQLEREVGVRQRAEAALQEQLLLLQTLIDAIPSPVYFKDTQGVYLGCNAAFEQMLGLRRTDIVGRPVSDVNPRGLTQDYLKANATLLADGGVQSFEETVPFADGSTRHMLFHKSTFFKADGTLGGLVGTMHDITARKRAETRIARLNECWLSFNPNPEENVNRLTSVCAELLEAAGAFYASLSSGELRTPGLWRLDRKAAESLEPLGRIAHDVIGSMAEEPAVDGTVDVPVVIRDLLETQYARSGPLVAQHAFHTFVGQAVRRDGQAVGCLGVFFKDNRELPEDDARLMGIIASGISVEEHRKRSQTEREELLRLIVEYNEGLEREVGERQRAEDQLQRYAAELAQTNEELKSFAYIISHDLRAPLINLKGFARELRLSVEEIRQPVRAVAEHLDRAQAAALQRVLAEDMDEAIGFIESSSARMDNLLNAILRLSRLGRRELLFEPLDMNALVREVLRTLAHQIEAAGVTVSVDALPPVTADYTSIDQIVGNLLDNAVKYLAPGRTAAIHVSAQTGEDMVTFYVRDNGRGIAEEEIPKIFDVFHRAGRQDIPGEGMGLAYVRTMVRRHGGDIRCSSIPGEGTTFAFTISRHLRDEEANENLPA